MAELIIILIAGFVEACGIDGHLKSASVWQSRRRQSLIAL